jgi:hypothetical protein
MISFTRISAPSPAAPARATRTLAAIAAILSTVAALGLTAGTASASATATSVAAKKSPTPFAFSAVGYGSRVKGGQVPAKSDASAFQSLGCTNLAGIDKRNHTATSSIDGVAAAKNIRTRTWTTSRAGIVASNSLNQIERLHLSQEDVGAVQIERFSSFSQAFHDRTGFHATTETIVGDITYRATDGTTQDLDPPTLSQPVKIPGLLTISLGVTSRRASSTGARASADGLRIHFIPSDTTVVLAHTTAKLTKGVRSGLFGGRAAALETRSDDELLRTGPQPLLKMPCLGTAGEIHDKSTAAAGESSAIGAYEATTRQRGLATKQSANGFEEATISSAVVGGGQLSLSGIVGRVNVSRTKAGLVRDTTGTTIGSIMLGDQAISLPELDGFTIPGLVRVDTNVTTNLPNGIDVVAVRLTFLDGSGRVTDLGHARLEIRHSGVS